MNRQDFLRYAAGAIAGAAGFLAPSDAAAQTVPVPDFRIIENVAARNDIGIVVARDANGYVSARAISRAGPEVSVTAGCIKEVPVVIATSRRSKDEKPARDNLLLENIDGRGLCKGGVVDTEVLKAEVHGSMREFTGRLQALEPKHKADIRGAHRAPG